ncbi:MAG: ABC transporter ATP-binding protein [Thermoplasmataceae archaeon]|jgi:ABC-2 type transport system ATP-binding protein
MITTENLRKSYKNRVEALKGITTVLDRRVTSIIGRNGAGKTTFIRILSTQLMPTSGSAFINGVDVVKFPDRIRGRIVSIPQEASPIGILTPFEIVKMYLTGRGQSLQESTISANKALEELGISEFRNKPTDTLSGGTKRKVFVAMAIASNADIIFLDEPTTGLDPISRIEVWSAIKQIQGDIILTTHYMEEASELSNEVVLIDGGRIIEKGSVKDLMQRFEGLVRVEGKDIKDPEIVIGSTRIKYVKKEEAMVYIEAGEVVKPVSLDDVFIKHGVEIEY